MRSEEEITSARYFYPQRKGGGQKENLHGPLGFSFTSRFFNANRKKKKKKNVADGILNRNRGGRREKKSTPGHRTFWLEAVTHKKYILFFFGFPSVKYKIIFKKKANSNKNAQSRHEKYSSSSRWGLYSADNKKRRKVCNELTQSESGIFLSLQAKSLND